MSTLREKQLAKAREGASKRALVPVTFNGDDMFVRRMSGRERDAYETGLVEFKGRKRSPKLANLRARLAVLVLCDAEGNLIFTEDDADILGDGDCAELDKVYELASKHNALSEEAKEDIEKN